MTRKILTAPIIIIITARILILTVNSDSILCVGFGNSFTFSVCHFQPLDEERVNTDGGDGAQKRDQEWNHPEVVSSVEG